MSRKNLYSGLNKPCLLIVIIVYLAGQILIGAFSPVEKGYHPAAIFHMDFLNYASILKQLFSSFPPPNPNFGGVPLTQSWLHHIPAALLAQFISPMLSIRIFNFIWLIVFIILLRRYFPSQYGILAFLLLCLSVPGWEENPLSIDLIIRTFHHMPFFVFLFIAIFEKNRFLKYTAYFLLPWLHGFMALAVFSFFIAEAFFKKDRESFLYLLLLAAGLYTYSLFFTLFSEESRLSFLLQKLSFKPKEPLVHLLPFIPFIIFCRDKRWWVLGGAGGILSSVIQWNNYYLIFILNVAIALALIDAQKYMPETIRKSFAIVAVICFIFFLNGLCHKYNSENYDPYRAYPAYRYRHLMEWVARNTEPGDVFLIYPPDSIEDIPFMQELRPVYLGWAPFAEILGLPAKERKERAISFYHGEKIESSIKYILYGEREKMRFPGFQNLNYPEVYADGGVVIYKNKERICIRSY